MIHKRMLLVHGSSKKRFVNLWLTANNESLGCTVCSKVTNPGVHQTKSMHLSTDWASFQIKKTDRKL